MKQTNELHLNYHFTGLHPGNIIKAIVEMGSVYGEGGYAVGIKISTRDGEQFEMRDASEVEECFSAHSGEEIKEMMINIEETERLSSKISIFVILYFSSHEASLLVRTPDSVLSHRIVDIAAKEFNLFEAPPEFIIQNKIHPEIMKVSQSLFKSGHYSEAVFEAFKRIILEVESLTPKSINYKDDYGLMGRIFSPEQPDIIKFNQLTDDIEQGEQRGLMHLFQGVVLLRNVKGHRNTVLYDKFRAGEYLTLASLLMNRLKEKTN